MRTFADIPAEIERLFAGGRDRVGVILLDAFGRRFLERHAEHPFLRRLEVTELSTQFPSTTTAHVTTMHTGRPLGEHGLYEWNVYEPALDAIVTPLRFSFAGDDEPDTVRHAQRGRRGAVRRTRRARLRVPLLGPDRRRRPRPRPELARVRRS